MNNNKLKEKKGKMLGCPTISFSLKRLTMYRYKKYTKKKKENLKLKMLFYLCKSKNIKYNYGLIIILPHWVNDLNI